MKTPQEILKIKLERMHTAELYASQATEGRDKEIVYWQGHYIRMKESYEDAIEENKSLLGRCKDLIEKLDNGDIPIDQSEITQLLSDIEALYPKP